VSLTKSLGRKQKSIRMSNDIASPRNETGDAQSAPLAIDALSPGRVSRMWRSLPALTQTIDTHFIAIPSQLQSLSQSPM
jgi:hypothetical protein